MKKCPLGNSRKMMFNHHLHHWPFPTYFHFFILPLISPTFPSFSSKELSVGMGAKGKAFGVYRFFFQLAAAHFGFWEVQGISNTSRIISPLGKSHEIVFNLALSYSGFPNLSCFSLFLPYSLHFPPKNSRWEAFGSIGFLTHFSSFWASWVVLGAAHFGFWEVQHLNTPKVMSPLGRPQEIVFNLALSCSVFLTFHIFPYSYFSHIPYISLQRTLDGKRSFFW